MPTLQTLLVDLSTGAHTPPTCNGRFSIFKHGRDRYNTSGNHNQRVADVTTRWYRITEVIPVNATKTEAATIREFCEISEIPSSL